MRRTRTADGGRGAPLAAVAVAGRHPPLPRAAVARAVRAVLRGERSEARVSVTFLGERRMRALNAEWKGIDRPTDVLAFALEDPEGRVTGDVYVCRAVAKREAAARGLPLREELLRLVIHGTLHVLGYDHPEDGRRTRSAMWRKQEHYLACLG